MGFFDKLFGTQKQSNVQSSISEKQNPYIHKYKRMEAEGKVIDWDCVKRTDNSKYPYPCATKSEKNRIDNAIKNYIKGIFALTQIYTMGQSENKNNTDSTIYKDLDKKNYWKNKLIEYANSGNRNAQASLIYKSEYCEDLLSVEERQLYENKYKEKLIADAENDDPFAQFAVAEFELNGAVRESDKRSTYLKNAGNAGIGDAFYLLAQDFIFECMHKNKDFNEKENIDYFYDLYIKGVNTGNGVFLGEMQNDIGRCYYEGINGFKKDLVIAKQYYENAIKNGSKEAINNLEVLNRYNR